MQALYIPSYANNKPLKYYDNRNRIMIAFDNASIAKRIMDRRNESLDRTITRIMLVNATEQKLQGYDTYRCKMWIYPSNDITQIQIINTRDIANYGDSFAVIDNEEGFEYGANLYVPNGPIIDVDLAIEIPNT